MIRRGKSFSGTKLCRVFDCGGFIKEGHLVCADHWGMVPEETKSVYYKNPGSFEVQAAVLMVLGREINKSKEGVSDDAEDEV